MMYFLRDTKDGSFFITEDYDSKEISVINEKGEREVITHKGRSLEILDTRTFMSYLGQLKTTLKKEKEKAEISEFTISYLLTDKELAKGTITKIFGTDEIPLFGPIQALFNN